MQRINHLRRGHRVVSTSDSRLDKYFGFAVRFIDFEISRHEGVSASDIENEDDIVEDLLIELLGDCSPCSGSGSSDGTVKDDAPA